MANPFKPELTTDPFSDKDFSRLFDEFYVPLCRFCISLVVDKAAAEDIVQELFVYLWEKRERIAFGGSIRSYLFTSVKNRSLNYLKLHYPNRKVDELDSMDETLGNETSSPASDLIEGNELETLFDNALKKLPTQCRTIFSMKRFGEMTNKEIAEKLEISLKTVEAQMTIAIRKLRDYLIK
jgi:RNA polymerase sigma-70 factor (ECF subfamily)